jgi:SAM-dependent methyltransferase
MQLPIATGSCDAAILVHILHLVDDWATVLDEVVRVVRAGGVIAIANDEQHLSDPLMPPDQVWPRWSAILDELGVPPEQRRARAVRGLDARFVEYLHRHGAAVERVTVLEYQRLPSSAREVAARFRDRLLSSSWSLPDEIHAEAALRLDHWITHDCTDPDTPYASAAHVDAIIARLPHGV